MIAADSSIRKFVFIRISLIALCLPHEIQEAHFYLHQPACGLRPQIMRRRMRHGIGEGIQKSNQGQ